MATENPFSAARLAPNPFPGITFRDAGEAFEDAIKAGRLSRDPKAENYAGRFMYMGTKVDGRKDLFKSIDTREYLA